MINENVLKSIFKNYKIGKVVLVKEKDVYNFIISEMRDSLSLDRWDYLENTLKDVVGTDVNVFDYNQALEYLKMDYVKKGVVIL